MRTSLKSVRAVGMWPLSTRAVAAVSCGMLTATALADVTITARQSTAYAFHEEVHPINPRIFWEESDTFQDLGPWSVTLPASGYSHADHADSDGIGGVFVGFFFGGNSPMEHTHEGQRATQTVAFYNEAPRPVSIRFNGYAFPWFAGNELVNMKLMLTNTDTNQVVFDIHRDGTGSYGFVSVSYLEQAWSAELPQGHYEVLALGDFAWTFSNAGHLSAQARVDFMMTFGELSCPVDFNGDGFLDFFDYSDFVGCFEFTDCPFGRSADFNGDGFVDFFDYMEFVTAFESGC